MSLIATFHMEYLYCILEVVKEMSTQTHFQVTVMKMV